MIELQNLPEGKRIVLEELTGQLREVKGMVAVALGGSYATGTQNEQSDLDIGLYYDEATPFSISAIRELAGSISVRGAPTVTDFYGWGAWVNGGAWIYTAQGKVDFVYRNVDQLQRTIAEVQRGVSHHDYDQQPAYGFYSVIYLAEIQACIPLYDPLGALVRLKQEVAVYPPRLKQRVVADSLWSTEFTLIHARGFAAKGDIYNTVGCLTRAAANLTQTLFALNERYFIRDKQVMATLGGFPILPQGYVGRIEHLLACPGSTADELARAVQEMEAVWRSVVSLPHVQYEPMFSGI